MQTLSSSATHISESHPLKRSQPSRDLERFSCLTQASPDRTEEHLPFLLESGLTLFIENELPEERISSELETLPPFDLRSLSDLRFVVSLFEAAGTVVILNDTRMKDSIHTNQKPKKQELSIHHTPYPAQKPKIQPFTTIPGPVLPAPQNHKRKRTTPTPDLNPTKKPKIEEKAGNPEAENGEKRVKKMTSVDVISQLVAAKKKEKEERAAAMVVVQTEKRESKGRVMRGEEIYADCGLTKVRQKQK